LRPLASMFRSKQAAPVSEHAKLRSLQISEFLKLNPTAQLVGSANGPSDPTTTYTLPLQTGSAGLLTLHVVLGPLFPERPPSCQLTTSLASLRLHHRYLDASGYLSLHPKLQSAAWTPHSNLGLLIQGLAAEIMQQPPQLVGGQAPAFSAAPQQQQQPPLPAGYGSFNGNSHPQQRSGSGVYTPPSQQSFSQPSPSQPAASPQLLPRQHSPSVGVPTAVASSSSSSSAASPASASSGLRPSRTRPPDVPPHFPQLDCLSIADLEDTLLIGDDAVRDQAAEVEVLKQMEARAADIAGQVSAKAKENLSQRAHLEALTAQLASETARLKEAQQHNASLLHRHQRVASRYCLSHVLHELDAAIAEADEASEETKERFEAISAKQAAAGNEDQQMLELFIKQRMQMHERAAKKERIIEIYGRT